MQLQHGGHRERAEAEALYRDILQSHPGHADSLHNLGVLAAQRGDLPGAIQCFRSALNGNPAHAVAYQNLGVALRMSGQPEEALESFRRALALQPDSIEALYEAGNTCGELRRFEAALACYEKVLALRPDFVAALVDRGNALSDLARHAEALASFDRALALQPDFPEALHNRGLTLAAVGRPEEALASFERALRLRPEANVYLHRGGVLQRLGRYEEALASAAQALELEPRNADALAARGDASLELKHYGDALASYEAAMAASASASPNLLCNRATALSGLGRDEEAIAECERALRLQAAFPTALACKAIALRNLDRLAEAVRSVEQALALDPHDGPALAVRGVLHRDSNQYTEALACYERALAARPDFANARFLQSWAWLVTGDLRRGFEAYEWRWADRQLAGARRRYEQPSWRGETPLAGRTILVYAEQGLGDSIQFCRFVPRLAAEGARVVLEVQPSLVPLLSPLPGVHQLVAQGGALPGFDLHCPLLSLPFALRIDSVAAIPASRAYLGADQEALARWRDRLGAPTRPRVGIAWSGSARNVNDRRRSLPLRSLLEAFGPGVELFSIQKELRNGDRRVLGERPDLRDFTGELADFRETAALVSCMDLVVSVDTSVAHLAGALGVPVWILLPFAPDWRWLLDREDSPWYRSARLFRQPAPDDWAGVMQRLRDAARDDRVRGRGAAASAFRDD